MIFKDKKFTLKNGKEVLFRSPRAEDAEGLLEFLEKIALETDFLVRSPGEDMNTADKERKHIERLNNASTALMILAEADGKIAGSCTLNVGNRKKTHHRGTLGITILREFWNLGIGTHMIEEIASYAKKIGVTQLELQVMDSNERAIRLYERMGFEKIGFLPNAYKQEDGSFCGQYMMIKVL